MAIDVGQSTTFNCALMPTAFICSRTITSAALAIEV